MTLALFTAQIGHYHDARYRAVAATGMPFTVLATQNEADFAEFSPLSGKLSPGLKQKAYAEAGGTGRRFGLFTGTEGSGAREDAAA